VAGRLKRTLVPPPGARGCDGSAVRLDYLAAHGKADAAAGVVVAVGPLEHRERVVAKSGRDPDGSSSVSSRRTPTGPRHRADIRRAPDQRHHR
jgi:hypothetical protein